MPTFQMLADRLVLMFFLILIYTVPYRLYIHEFYHLVLNDLFKKVDKEKCLFTEL